MYLAPIESATVLSISETATRSHKSVPIPNHRKLIGSVSDNRVPDRNLDAFPKQVLDVCNKACIFAVRRDINSRWKTILDAGYAVHCTF